MRVAYYNHTSAVSGAEINLMVTAKHYTKVHPIIFAPEGELLDRARKDWLEVVPLPSFNARLSRNPLRLAAGAAGMIKAGRQLSEAVRAYGIDVIHANSLRAGMMASLFYWHHRIPVIWHLHDIPPKGLIGKVIRMYALWAAQSVIAISESVMKDYQKLGERIHLVHNGAVLSEFSGQEKAYSREKIRSELHTPQDGRVMTIIGQIAPWKRQADAIRALHALLQHGEENYLWIVGEPKFRQENEQYLEELHRLADQLKVTKYIRFTGFREDVDEICCASDLLLLCSENEPFGRVIIEAMAQGTPVIATNGGGVAEIIKHGRSGLLYTTGNIMQLVQCIQDLQRMEPLRRLISDNAIERIKEHFSIGQAAAKTEMIYMQAMNGGTGINRGLRQTKGVAK
ncbi:glycosyltransferase family 4 protein [Paenibacillus lupini]|uniref:glycosyltransferase family 4 protein n=1 Tax=Paenibacillus lupini TaxID=1450204 RepID=UPI00142276F3|nr:glycosyltransferase family 4 protein [Paenibacillus lupini]NIK26287.1 glycosyltransferase involved in cell wall biosynthesis [Paenibacillus lupini]